MCIRDSDNTLNLSIVQPTPYVLDSRNNFITADRVRWAINTFKPNKAAGLDGIKAVALKNCGPKMIQRLTTFYQASLLLSYVPSQLCLSKVIFLPKPGKVDYSKPKAFRPISLTSILFKVLERIALNEIENTHLTIKPLNKNQHAYRKGSSCDSALSDMVDDIEKSILRGEYALGVYLDISGAFNNVKTTSAIEGMKKADINPSIINWYANYLYNQIAISDIKGCKVIYALNTGELLKAGFSVHLSGT